MNRLGHVGYAFLFAGMVALAQGYPAGWALRLVGEWLWVYVGYRLGLSSVWFWGAVFGCIDIYACWRNFA